MSKGYVVIKCNNAEQAEEIYKEIDENFYPRCAVEAISLISDKPETTILKALLKNIPEDNSNETLE